MRALTVIVIMFFILSHNDVLASSDGTQYSESFLCRSQILQKLFNLACTEAASDSQAPEETDETRSIKLRFFTPPESATEKTGSPGTSQSDTNNSSPEIETTTNETEISPDENNISTSNENSVSSPFPPVSGNPSVQSVIWVYQNVGRCFSSWAIPSCKLISHEDGVSKDPFDITGDGKNDITCSIGSGTNKSTTITNISDKPLSLRCERYGCNSCTSANGTHTTCNGGIDPSSQRDVLNYTLEPGQSETCSVDGIGKKVDPPPVPQQNPSSSQNPPPSASTTAPNPSWRTSCVAGNGYCSFSHLRKFFPTDDSALKASMICKLESNGNATAGNYSCRTGGSVDYSVGLFQINLLAHCAGGFSYTWNPPSCRIKSASSVTKCVSQYQDPIQNIQKAVALSRNGTNWFPWASAKRICNIP